MKIRHSNGGATVNNSSMGRADDGVGKFLYFLLQNFDAFWTMEHILHKLL